MNCSPHYSTPTVFVLSWEDVLVPSAALAARIGLHSTRTAFDAARTLYQQDSYLQQAVRAIEDQAVELVRVASRLGPVVVVSDHSTNYLDLVSAAFFPRLALWLANANIAAARGERFRVEVVAAPRKFSSGVERAAWRAGLYQDICRAAVGATPTSRKAPSTLKQGQRILQFPESGTLGLLSVSASVADRFSCLKAMDVAPFLVPKCVHVPGGDATDALGLEEFFAQLRTLQQYLATAAAHRNAFATSLVEA